MFNRHWGQDRRRYQRLNLNLIVWYKVVCPDSLRSMLGEKEKEVLTIDIGPLGMAFMCRYHLPSYSTLLLKFIVFSAHAGSYSHLAIPLELQGVVRSSLPSEDNEYRIGICFKDIPTEKQLQLARFVEESLRPCI
ncbi:MAG: PilZ domain-containing protein [Candidatus Omnitrophica bacterium]|nr:PilZ domain-containing protein [Candidatus Omnitrophota bacterium]